MSKRKGEETPYTIDRKWPHQVAIQDDLCVMANFTTIATFLDGASISTKTRTVLARWADGHVETYRVHCFKTPEDAAGFMERFGGVPFDPATDRTGGSRGEAWHRTGPYIRLLESGPLRVPPLLVF